MYLDTSIQRGLFFVKGVFYLRRAIPEVRQQRVGAVSSPSRPGDDMASFFGNALLFAESPVYLVDEALSGHAPDQNRQNDQEVEH